MNWVRKIPWWLWLVVGGVLVGLLAGGFAGNKLLGAGYTSTSQVLVTGQGVADQPDSAYSSNQYVNQRMSTYSQIALSAQVAGPAAVSLGEDPQVFATQIGATVEGDTTVLTLAVKGATPELAKRNGTAVTQAFINTITKLETAPGGKPRVLLNVITDPLTPPSRSLPALWLWLLAGAIGGGALGFAAYLMIRWLYPKSAAWGRTPAGPEQTQRLMPVIKPKVSSGSAAGSASDSASGDLKPGKKK